jgi:aspartyl protease
VKLSRCTAPSLLSLATLMYVPVVHATCRLEQFSEFHVELVGNAPVIPGQVNGQPIRILLETGSFVSYITDTAAHQLGLPIRE